MPSFIGPLRTTRLLNNSEHPNLKNPLQIMRALQPLLDDVAAADGGENASSAKLRFLHGLEVASTNPDMAQLATALAARQKQLWRDLGPSKVAVGSLEIELVSDLSMGLSTLVAPTGGLTLLRPYGIPYYPSSSFKGVLASYIAEVLLDKFNPDNNEVFAVLDRTKLISIWGSPSMNAGCEFFDLLPTRFKIGADITSPHHARYYINSEAPAGFSPPVPVLFPIVRAGSRFQVGFAVRRSMVWEPTFTDAEAQLLADANIKRIADPSPVAFLYDAIRSMVEHHGIGAQTSSGYGRAKVLENTIARIPR